MRPTNRFSSLVAVALLLAGCASTETVKVSESLEAPFTVKRGTQAAALIENLGEPDQKYPLADYSVEAMVWVYKRKVGAQSRMVVTGTRDRVYYDRIREITVVVPEAILQPEVTNTNEVTKILVVRDRVVSWGRSIDEGRQIEGLTR